MRMSEFRNQNDHPIGGDYYNDVKETANASVFLVAFGSLDFTQL